MKQLQTKKPWERLEDETDTAYHRFSVYLKLGPDRSIPGVAKQLQKGDGYAKFLRKWSAKYSWVDRATAYDEQLILKSLKNKEEILDKGKARLLGMMDKALDEMEGVLDLDHNDVIDEDVEGGQKKLNLVNASIVAQKLKAIDSVLNRIGLIEQKELPPASGGSVTINNYVQNIYNKMRRLEDE